MINKKLLSLSDDKLAHLSERGNRDALNVLISRHAKKLKKSLYLKTHDVNLTNDLFQETVEKIAKKIPLGKYKPSDKFQSWAQKVGFHVFIDYCRKKKKTPSLNATDDIGEKISIAALFKSEENPENILIAREEEQEMKKLVHILLDSLNPKQREVVVMRHFHNMAFKDIADATGVCTNTALGRMRYANIKMKKKLELISKALPT